MIQSKFAIVTHIMTILASMDGEYISSTDIAGSLNINPTLVRKEIAELKKHNYVESKEGKYGGLKLLKPANKIKLSDIFKLVKGNSSTLSFAKNEPNPNCPIGKKINKNLNNLFIQIDNNIYQSLNEITLEDFKNQF